MAEQQQGTTDTAAAATPAKDPRAALTSKVEARASAVVESVEEKKDEAAAAAAEEKAKKNELTAAKRGKNRARERIKSLTDEAKALRAELNEVKARVSSGDGSAAETAFIEKIRKNPGLLFDKSIGLELQAISKAYLESVDPETRARLEADGRLKALEDKATAAERRAAAAEYSSAQQGAINFVRQLVGEDKERWELVNRDKSAAKKILARAQKRIEALGRKVSDKEAAAIVKKCADKQEKIFEERGKLYSKGGTGTSSTSDKVPTKNQTDARTQRVGPKTITSSLRGGGGGTPPNRDGMDGLSAKERLQRRIEQRRAQA
jgi:hypothetical protein